MVSVHGGVSTLEDTGFTIRGVNCSCVCSMNLERPSLNARYQAGRTGVRHAEAAVGSLLSRRDELPPFALAPLMTLRAMLVPRGAVLGAMADLKNSWTNQRNQRVSAEERLAVAELLVHKFVETMVTLVPVARVDAYELVYGLVRPRVSGCGLDARAEALLSRVFRGGDALGCTAAVLEVGFLHDNPRYAQPGMRRRSVDVPGLGVIVRRLRGAVPGLVATPELAVEISEAMDQMRNRVKEIFVGFGLPAPDDAAMRVLMVGTAWQEVLDEFIAFGNEN